LPSREDIGALRMISTPEMASYFDDELEANRARGLVNRVSDVKLLQGDLACSASIRMEALRRVGWSIWRSRRGDDCRAATVTQAIFS
jgi:hypothetical protein